MLSERKQVFTSKAYFLKQNFEFFVIIFLSFQLKFALLQKICATLISTLKIE